MDNKITIVIPCFNEEAVISNTLDNLLFLLQKLISDNIISKDSQICIINDGSTDKTQEIIDKYTKETNQIAYIKFTNNFGQQAAFMAGIKSVNSSAIITLDADLQDDYTIIPDMIKKYKEGYDIVYGVRNKRTSDKFFKRITSEMFYNFMNLIGVKLINNHADFRLLSSNAIKLIRQFNEKTLFLRGLVTIIGLKSCNLYYDRLPRKNGKSKYSFKKMISFSIDGMTAFSSFPLRFIDFIGILMLLSSILLILYGMFDFSFKILIVFILLFSNSLILISLGIIGEYINKIYIETKNRPLYFIEKTTNL